MIERNKDYTTQLNGRTITVKTVEIEQRVGRKRGKWVCINQQTGHKVWRTSRQLHPIVQGD